MSRLHASKSTCSERSCCRLTTLPSTHLTPWEGLGAVDGGEVSSGIGTADDLDGLIRQSSESGRFIHLQSVEWESQLRRKSCSGRGQAAGC